MRGAYTAGVLDFFLDAGIDFPLVATASSSALLGCYFISKQRGTNLQIFRELMSNPDTISIKRMFTHKEIFRMDFIFDHIPNRLVPFDYEAFAGAESTIVIGTTDIKTGESCHHAKFASKEELFTLVRASGSLPVLAPFVSYRGRNLVDGGVSDPIPIRPSMDAGYEKNVVILTRNRGYVKKATRLNWFYRLMFKQYPELRKLLKARHHTYNQTMNLLTRLENQGKVFMIRPEKPLIAKRLERNKEILHDLYWQGYREAEQKREDLLKFVGA